MKRSLFLFLGIIIVVLYANQSYAKPPGCQNSLNICTDDLNLCNANLAACESVLPGQTFPGDGYPNPDAFGVSGHGPALSYADNGDGTFTDLITGLMWEIKDDADGIHDKDNTYPWTSATGGTGPTGTLFTDFLDKINNTCEGAGITPCSMDSECSKFCGLAGHQDWRIPNIKELQSIVDYSILMPASSLPGDTGGSNYWSATTLAANATIAWSVSFGTGDVNTGINTKTADSFARAVRTVSD